MATKELPELIREFVEMSRDYLRQETVEPAKALGRFAGFSIGAAVAWMLGSLLVGIAMMRAVVNALPDSPYWEALGYMLAALVVTGAIAAIVYVGQSGDERGSP